MLYIKPTGRIAPVLSISSLRGVSPVADTPQETVSQPLGCLPETPSHSTAAAFAGMAGNQTIGGKLPPCLIQNIAHTLRFFYATASRVLAVDSGQYLKLNTAPNGAQTA